MRIRPSYSLFFLCVMLVFILFARRTAPLGWIFLWPALSYLILAAAYAGFGPRVFGKQADGRLAWWGRILLGPHRWITWVIWLLIGLLGREPPAHEIAPGLWLGRRPYRRNLPADTSLVVDLTAEFPAARGVIPGRTYRCIPTLDMSIPALEDARELVRLVSQWQGTVYLHCAAGHGRSAMVAAAVLLERGLASDPLEAEELVRKIRPGIHLTRAQRRLLHRLRTPAPLQDASGR